MSNMLSLVRLLAVPLENDYKHTYHFDDVETQTNFFLDKSVSSPTAIECSYQRKDKMIRFPACIDDIIKYNYVMYRNGAYSEKWYYAFITRMEYKNDEMTEIYIETDVLQTWLKEYKVLPSFIEREHVDDDTIGKHTIPEQLETGDYIVNAVNKNSSLANTNIIVATTVNLNRETHNILGKETYASDGGGNYNGIYSGLRYYLMDGADVGELIEDLADKGQSDAIVSIFMCPSLYVDTQEGEKGFAEVTASMNVKRKEWVNTTSDVPNYKPTSIGGINANLISNNKLFTYPYCYMLMSNNSGASAVYKYELFNNPNDSKLCDFYIESALTPGFSITLKPRYYNGVEINNLESLPLGKFPVCAWATDVYTNWLTQNAVNIPLSLGSALVQTGLGVASSAIGLAGAMATGGGSLVALGMLGGIGAGVSGATSIASTMGEIYQHSLQPPQAEGNINSGDVTYASKNLTFTAYQMTIKPEYVKIIDNYFTMFGYKVNRLGNPLKNHRQSFWYTKTIDANIDGNLPLEDLQKIKQCYNNGITFWKNHDYFGNYIVPNAITV